MGTILEKVALQQTVECRGKQVCIDFDRSYTTKHLWSKATPEGNLKIGVTDYAQKFLKKKVALIEFMKNYTIDDEIEKDEIFCVIYGRIYADPKTSRYECMAFDMFAPVKGTIIEVNQAIMDKPQLVNDDCYDKGWIIVIKPKKWWKSASNFLEPTKYVKWLKNEEQSPLRVL